VKAIIVSRYGSPAVLQLKEVEKPGIDGDAVLVKVHAASANPLDWHHMRGKPILVRIGGGLFRPKDRRIGVDVAGVVEALGSNAMQFKVGDEVFGICAGGFAEYTATREKNLILKSAKNSFGQAAAVPVAGTTALQGLRDYGHIQPGQKVLINGASGGVGTFAVQIAKSYGADVTGVCSTRNLELVRSIGADDAVDYTKEDFTRSGRLYDLIFDAVGNHSVSDYKRALKPQGACVVAGFSGLSRLFQHAVVGPARSKPGGQKVGLMGIAKVNQGDLGFLKGLTEAGKVVPVIDRRYPLADTAEAIRYLEQGHARGKVVVDVIQQQG
jgi:NADPH:quinone reductase-like Zn-dependent oxidoreductase